MTLDEKSDERVLEAWTLNAHPWSDAVRGKKIESRNLVTDNAILEAVTSRAPRTVLDLGCGEGWLARALAARSIAVIGVDAIPALIEAAKAMGGAEFRVASYEEIAAGGLDVKVDAVVANFSLIGKEAVDAVIARVPQFIQTEGFFAIQTPHPVIASEGFPYEDGWREGSWAGCGDNFSQAAPWYFRTIETWVRLLRRNGLHNLDINEPLHPITRKPASLILIAAR